METNHTTTKSTTHLRPVIVTEDEQVDPFKAYASKMITTRQLRAGMILLDEFDTPCYVLDSREGYLRNCGPEWSLRSVGEPGKYQTTAFAASLQPNVRVAAA